MAQTSANTRIEVATAPVNGTEEIVNTVCYRCFSACGVRVRKVNGVVRAIQGDPNCPSGQGKTCAKGISHLIGLHDPNLVLNPLRRTNPKKWRGVDPGWVETGWDEALDFLAQRLSEIRAMVPRKMMVASFDNMGNNGAGLAKHHRFQSSCWLVRFLGC